jgi:hypothetical protein
MQLDLKTPFSADTELMRVNPNAMKTIRVINDIGDVATS